LRHNWGPLLGRQALLLFVALLLLLATGGSGASALPNGFQETTLPFSGLTNPTAIQFAADGRIFVAEKSGKIKVFSNLNDSTADLFADLGPNVHNYWDRGMLGLALDPGFTTGRPYVYVLYTFDAPIGGSPPTFGDACGDPTGNGCVVSARLSRLAASGNQMTGPEQVLINDWCEQYPSHSIGSLAFGADGALYVSAGDGASFNFTDWGQDGSPLNPCGDPPGGVGGQQSPPSAEGGALRSQDLRTPFVPPPAPSDPTSLDGAVQRVNPDTGAGMPNNPLAGSSDANERRIIAHGFRNPFRMTIRPGTNEVWVGDVGWNDWEEIDRIADPLGSIENFGWPCYEGAGHQPGYDSSDLTICENLYALPGGVVSPYYTYNHGSQVVSGDGCPTQNGSSAAGVAFYQSGPFPDSYDGALFFADYSRNCIWVMFPGGNGLPNTSNRATFLSPAASPVDLKVGPDGALYYADFNGGTIRRIAYGSAQPPVAVATGSPTSGPVPLSVNFDGSGSSDPEGGPLTYAWDLDGDGAFDDSTAVAPTFTYTQAGTYNVKLRVTDSQSLSATSAPITIAPGDTPPTASIDAPAAGTKWKVGDAISFSGSATDPEQGTLPASAFTWDVILHHCPSSCHTHPVQTFTGVKSGSFAAPDHEYPSHLELRLTVTDSGGLTDTKTLQLDPRTVDLSFDSVPSGLQLTVGSTSSNTPFTRTVIEGSNNSIIAPTPQALGGTNYGWVSWSDGGARSHNVVANAAGTYTATYQQVTSPTCPNGQYLAEYFANQTLTGDPTFWRCESAITNDWGPGGPGNGVGPDNFSVRWSGKFDFAAGTYSFTTRADDGVRLWVDGEQLVDAWVDQGPTTYQATKTLAAGEHDVKLEFYENGGDAAAELSWVAVPTAGSCPKGLYYSEYFANQTLGGQPAFTQCESALNYDWGGGGPGNGLGNDGFSVRWSSKFDFAADTYTFSARADDGVRLWVDGQLLIDAWIDQGATTYQATKTLAAGEHDVKLEYYENGGDAVAQLSWSAANDNSPPTPPTGLSATAVSGTQINLAWTASTDNVGVTGYLLERCPGASCTNFVQVATPPGASYSDTGLQPATTYRYRVRAKDAVGNLSDYSSVQSATTPDTQPPTAPTGLSATVVSATQINLAWTASTDNVGVTGYRVERCPGTSCTNFVQVATPTDISFNDTGVQPATTYRYRVQAADAATNLSPYSSVQSATTPAAADMQPPTAPTGLTATAAGPNQVNLAWTGSTDNVGVTGYLVERCQGVGCSNFVQVGTPTGTFYNDSGLQAATSYSYRVRATDAVPNLSGYSTVQGATTLQAGSCSRSSAVWLTGLEHGAISTVGGGIFSTLTGTPTADNTIARSGTYSLRIADASTTSTVRALRSFSASSVIATHFAVRLDSLPSANANLAYVDSATDLVFGYNAASQRFQLILGSSTVAASTPVSAATWYAIDLRYDLSANLHRGDWRVSGVAQPAVSRSATPTTANGLGMGATANASLYTANFDDIVIAAQPTAYPVEDSRMVRLVPNSMGTSVGSANFRNNDATAIDANSWQRLDEVPTTSTVDYVRQQVASGTSYLEFGLQDTPATCIRDVSAVLAYHAAGSAANNGKTSIFDGANETVIFSGDTSQTALQYKSAIVRPAVGTWSQAALNGLVARVGYSTDSTPNPYWDSIMLEAAVP
jgi:glucose/arabinose dehydrogenase/chitodextrinase